MFLENSESERANAPDVKRSADDTDFSLFNATMRSDGIMGTRASSPWSTGDSRASSPFQTIETKPTSPFPNADRPNPPLSNTTNGVPWRAGWGDSSSFNPGSPVPNPWGSSTDTRPVPVPAPSFPRPNDAPRAPQPVPVPRPGNEPWDRAPGGPWSKPSPPGGGGGGPWDRGTPGGGGGPWDRGPVGNDSGRPGRPGNPGGVNPSEAVESFKRDQVTRTSYSFRDCVVKEKQLAVQSETALEQQMREWFGKQKDLNPITHMRGTAALACALGEFRLEEGSRIDLTSHQNTKPRILKGYDYDFGGEANTWLRMSAGSLVAAQQYVVGHKGLTIEGQPMDDAYLQQLKQLQTDVEKKLNVIYGPHDIESIYAEIRTQVRSKAGDWQQGLVRLQHQLDALQTTDRRFIAKSARDVALGYLAEADYMSSKDNGEEAKIMYQAANRYLQMSQQNDGNAPDNYALASISERLKPQIQKSLDNQWSDPFSNPFEIPNPNTTLV